MSNPVANFEYLTQLLILQILNSAWILHKSFYKKKAKSYVRKYIKFEHQRTRLISLLLGDQLIR
jgi:hypothetical protein